MEALYVWLSCCRLMSVNYVEARRDSAHDRNREVKRPAIARFFDDFLPTLSDHSSPRSEAPIDVRRRELVQEALESFDKAQAYKTMWVICFAMVAVL
jgi:hypothetical protein